MTIDSGSPSLRQPDYWWYRVRADLLERAVGNHTREADLVLDVGSADAPSAGWLHRSGRVVAVDVDHRGLRPGGVCGSAEALPFADQTFDAVAAFDVVEHCRDEQQALREIRRVLVPDGVLVMSVPAYQWAWTDHDVHNQHHRRYTRARAVAALESAGFEVVRATYMFAGTFPFFAADRLRTRVRERRRDQPADQHAHAEVMSLPPVSPTVERVLVGASGVDRRLLGRWNLPFGSSVVCAARRR
ncbi:MAG TPA: methyltransferase domain-containing protein [Nocardioides sp.]